MAQMVASKNFFSLGEISPQIKSVGGALTWVSGKEMPGLVNLAYAHLRLEKRGFVAPIWHTNAHKVGYCVQGKCLVTLRTPAEAATFYVEAGEMFFIPEGHVHHFEQTGDEVCLIHFALSHTHPETMLFSKALATLSDKVFEATFDAPTNVVKGFSSVQPITTLKEPSSFKESTTAYKFNIGSSPKTISTKGGYLQIGTKGNLPPLNGVGILGFGLNPGGAVEPHHHTNAGELVFIVKGKTEITILSPDGSVEVLEVKAGQGAFAPANHFHNILNTGKEEVEVIAFFSHAEPDYIGVGEVLGSFSNQTLATVFNTTTATFDKMKKPTTPLVIIPI